METEKKIFLIKIQSDNNLLHFFKMFKNYCLFLFFEVFIFLIFDFEFILNLMIII
jgi:hypothetical protein